MENNYVFSNKWDPATGDLFKAAANIHVELEAIPQSYSKVTIEDPNAFLATSKENTSSCKSGRHFGHYHAVSEDLDLTALHVASITLAA